jgi:hypothetical protein
MQHLGGQRSFSAFLRGLSLVSAGQVRAYISVLGLLKGRFKSGTVSKLDNSGVSVDMQED